MFTNSKPVHNAIMSHRRHYLLSQSFHLKKKIRKADSYMVHDTRAYSSSSITT